jgi:hypothetical protein
MKTLVAFLAAFAFVLGAYAQEETEQLSPRELRKLQKEQRKAEQAAEAERMAEVTKFMVENQQFVLEADFLSDKYGQRAPVTPTINFIIVDSLAGTVQFGDAQRIGYNGVGGATVDGKITKYEYTTVGKKGDAYSIRMMFMSSLGTYDITLMVNSSGNGDASIRGNWSDQLNYHGRLVPLTLSRIYKGTPIL